MASLLISKKKKSRRREQRKEDWDKGQKYVLGVYGTLRLGESNWRNFLKRKDVAYLGKKRVELPYAMYSDVIPYLVKDSEKHSIVMDFFEVPFKVKRRVDKLESAYTQKKSKVMLEGQPIEYIFYSYEGNPQNYGAVFVPDGDYVRFMKEDFNWDDYLKDEDSDKFDTVQVENDGTEDMMQEYKRYLERDEDAPQVPGDTIPLPPQTRW